jgi:hypothetical protein
MGEVSISKTYTRQPVPDIGLALLNPQILSAQVKLNISNIAAYFLCDLTV